MTSDEARKLCAAVVALWPHNSYPKNMPQTWLGILRDVPYELADAALRELVAEGREHAPAVGVVLRRVIERADSLPEWDETAREIEHAIRYYRRRPEPGELMTTEAELHGAPPPEYFSHPLVAAFAIPAWGEWRARTERERGTFMAQQRDAFNAMRGRVARERSLIAVGAPRPPGLRRPEPRRIEHALAGLLERGS